VTAEKWVPIIEVPVDSIKVYLQKKKREGFCILGLEQTANSVPLDQYIFPKKMVSIVTFKFFKYFLYDWGYLISRSVCTVVWT